MNSRRELPTAAQAEIRTGAIGRHESAPTRPVQRPVNMGDQSARVVNDPVLSDEMRQHVQEEPDKSKRAQEFLDRKGVRESISEAVHNNGTHGAEFISSRALCDIWHFLIAEFLDIIAPNIARNDISYIWENLLSIISVLVRIRWPDWHRFPSLFMEHMRDPILRRSDNDIPFEKSDLCDVALLGTHGEAFWNTQYLFHAITIVEGEPAEYPRSRPLPFLGKQREKLGQGSYGVVWKETIAPYHYLPLGHDNPKAVSACHPTCNPTNIYKEQGSGSAKSDGSSWRVSEGKEQSYQTQLDPFAT
jgi:hypothetical protein